MKYRFIDEYKNFRIRQLKEEIRFRREYPATDNGQYENEIIKSMHEQITEIEKIYTACRAGLITCDETMYMISRIGNYWMR